MNFYVHGLRFSGFRSPTKNMPLGELGKLNCPKVLMMVGALCDRLMFAILVLPKINKFKKKRACEKDSLNVTAQSTASGWLNYDRSTELLCKLQPPCHPSLRLSLSRRRRRRSRTRVPRILDHRKVLNHQSSDKVRYPRPAALRLCTEPQEMEGSEETASFKQHRSAAAPFHIITISGVLN